MKSLSWQHATVKLAFELRRELRRAFTARSCEQLTFFLGAKF